MPTVGGRLAALGGRGWVCEGTGRGAVHTGGAVSTLLRRRVVEWTAACRGLTVRVVAAEDLS